MRGDCGQASIEWIGAALLLALALGALGRFAGRMDAEPVASALLSSTTCATRGSCEAARRQTPSATPRHRSVTVPPLVPVPVAERRAPAPRSRPAPSTRARGGLGSRSVGVLWRRAWMLCFAYERARYGLLNPETGPRQTVPVSGALQMVNDCASPVDFARDWEYLRPR